MRIVELWRYPIKSLGGERLDASAVTELGLVGDRSWGIEDVTTGKILTARREAALLLAQGRLTADGVAEVHLGDEVLRTDDELSDWLGRPVRLCAAGAEVGGTYDALVDDLDEAHSNWTSWTGPTGAFHDSQRTRVSLISTATLAGQDPRRFRANVVLGHDSATGEENAPGGPAIPGETGVPGKAGVPDESASVEDGWVGGSLTVGSVLLDVRKHIDRCVMVTRPQPGLGRDLGVLKRINSERAGLAAIGALVTRPGRVAVGDTVAAQR